MPERRSLIQESTTFTSKRQWVLKNVTLHNKNKMSLFLPIHIITLHQTKFEKIEKHKGSSPVGVKTECQFMLLQQHQNLQHSCKFIITIKKNKPYVQMEHCYIFHKYYN